MENKADIKIEDRVSSNNEKLHETNLEEEYTPKLFSEEQNFGSKDTNEDGIEDNDAEQLFDKETTEDEDFEIPAFRRQGLMSRILINKLKNHHWNYRIFSNVE